MAYLGNKPVNNFVSFAKQDITGNGGTSYSLDYPVTGANDIELFINNVRQEPTEAYSCSGSTLTLTEAVTSTDDVYVIFRGRALQTVNAPENSVNATMLTDSAVTGAKIAADAVTADKLNVGQIGGRRNLIINGAMQVAQRGTSFTGVSGGGAHGADRWNFYNADGTAELTISNSSNAPSKFAKSMRIEVTTTSTPGANDYGHFYYAMEGQDLQQLGFGTSDAQQFTVSFWCRTNVPATYQWNVYNTDSGVLEGHTFTVNASNTWEYKTLTFSADATNGINNDTGDSFRNLVLLYAGTNFSSGTTPTTWTSHAIADRGAGLSNPTAFVGTVGNYFEITGVQLEVGDTATPFEHRSYGEELALCQRYFYQRGGGANKTIAHVYPPSVSELAFDITFPVTMRAIPSVSFSSNDSLTYRYAGNGSQNFTRSSGTISTGQVTPDGGSPWFAGWQHNQNHPGEVRVTSSTNFLRFDAEL